MPPRICPILTASIGGTVYPGAVIQSATDGVAPEIGSATIVIPQGSRRMGGVALDVDQAVAIRQAVVITSDDGYTWTGEVCGLHRRGTFPNGRQLVVECQGYGASLSRAILSTWYVRQTGGTSSQQVMGARAINGASGLPDRDRSADKMTISGLEFYVSDPWSLTRLWWTQANAIDSVLKVAQLDAGLGPYTLSDPDGLMVREAQWLVAGTSVFSTVAGIIGARADCWWLVTADEVVVGAIDGAGETLDLASPFVYDYNFSQDGRSTLREARVTGGNQTFILTLEHLTASGSGDLLPNWTGTNVTEFDGGNDEGPAYREFTISPDVMLPDGTQACLGTLMGSLPMQIVDLSGPTLLGGPGFNQPALLFHRSYTDLYVGIPGDAGWQQTAMGVSGGLTANGVVLRISGGDFPDLYRSTDRIAVTVAIQSAGRPNATVVGGTGREIGAYSQPGVVVQMLDGTALGVNGSGVLITSGAVLFQNDSDRMRAALDAWWLSYNTDGVSVSCSEMGVAGGMAPGTRITDAQVPTDDGTDTSTEEVGGVVLRRTIAQTPRGLVSRTLEIGWPQGNLSAIMGSA